MRRSLLLLVTAASVAGCHQATAPGTPVDAGAAFSEQDRAKARDELLKLGVLGLTEVEPNDTLETAQRIDQSRTISGEIQSVQPATKADEDWYLIQPARPQSVWIQLMDAAGGGASGDVGKFVLEVYDRDHTRIQNRSASLAHDAVSPELASLPALRVRDALYVRIAGHPFHYTLHVELKDPDPDAEAEPNDRAVDATPLPLDHPVHGTYATESDQDYYLVELAAGPALDAGAPPSQPPSQLDAGPALGDASTSPPVPPALPSAEPTEMLRIEVSAISGVRHSLTLFDETQVPLATFASHEAGGALFVRDYALRPGTSKLVVLLESAHGRKKIAAADFPSGQPYTITVHREPAAAGLELEPNDTLELATPLIAPPAAPSATASVHRLGFLSPAGDVDNYRLHLDAPARVHVTLSALERVDAELSVVESDPANGGGKTILKVNEGGTKEPEVIPAVALAAGDHFVRVQAAAHQVGGKWVRDQEDPDQPYQLDVELFPDDGSFEREPNNTTANATPITPGQTLSGFAYPAKDLDVYRLDLSAQPIAAGCSFRLTGVTKVPVELELRSGTNGSLGEILNASDPGKPGAEAQFQQKLDPGVYFLVVKPHPVTKAAGTPQADAETAYKLSILVE